MDFGIFSSLISVVLPQLLTKASESAASSAGKKAADYIAENGLWKSIVRVFVIMDEEEKIKTIEQKKKLSSEDIQLIQQTVVDGLKNTNDPEIIHSIKQAIGLNEVNEFIVGEKLKVILSLKERIEDLTGDLDTADMHAGDLTTQQRRLMRRLKKEVESLMKMLNENRL